jgi:hypothetical protein
MLCVATENGHVVEPGGTQAFCGLSGGSFPNECRADQRDPDGTDLINASLFPETYQLGPAQIAFDERVGLLSPNKNRSY